MTLSGLHTDCFGVVLRRKSRKKLEMKLTLEKEIKFWSLATIFLKSFSEVAGENRTFSAVQGLT